MLSKKKTICLSGTHSLVHAFTAVLTSKGFKTTILETKIPREQSNSYSFSDENNIMAEFYDGRSYEGSPECVSSEPKELIAQSDAFFFLDNYSNWETKIKEIAPHIPEHYTIGCIPGGGGFEWMLRNAVDEELYKTLHIFELSPLPYESKIETFGKSTHILKEENNLYVSYHSSNSEEVLNMLQDIFKAKINEIFPILSQNFLNPEELITPARLYRLFENHEEDKTYNEHPELYNEIHYKDLMFIEDIVKEACELGEALQNKMKVEFPLSILTNALESLQLEQTHAYDSHQAQQAGYQLPNSNVPNYISATLCPMERTGQDEFRLDLNSIYFKEYIPHQYCYLKGVAEILDIKTPAIDKVLLWAQTHMKKEYLKGGKLRGKDVNESSAPQKFGFKKIEDLYI